MNLDVEVQRAIVGEPLPSDNEFRNWATKAYLQIPSTSVTIRIVDKKESQMLNGQYRQQPRPTNVLSFPLDLPDDVGENFLGDIVVCAPVVNEEALSQQKSLYAHWAHMVVHAMLHLQGYDHEQDEAAVEMEALETQILQSLGYPDPYANQSLNA